MIQESLRKKNKREKELVLEGTTILEASRLTYQELMQRKLVDY